MDIVTVDIAGRRDERSRAYRAQAKAQFPIKEHDVVVEVRVCGAKMIGATVRHWNDGHPVRVQYATW